MDKSLKVLIVDDDMRMARTLASVLAVKGYESVTSVSACDALEKVKGGSIGCVVSDIKMPGINGVELCRAVKGLRRELPLVLMTAYSSDELVRRGLSEGAVAVLSKPLDLDRLLRFFSLLYGDRSVVVLDDDLQFGYLVAEMLGEGGYSVKVVGDPGELDEVLGVEGQVLVLGTHSGGKCSELEVLRAIREGYPELPAVLVEETRGEVSCERDELLSMGVAGTLSKPFEIEELSRLLDRVYLQMLRRILEQVFMID